MQLFSSTSRGAWALAFALQGLMVAGMFASASAGAQARVTFLGAALLTLAVVLLGTALPRFTRTLAPAALLLLVSAGVAGIGLVAGQAMH